jgi:Flp pilus assembly protein TadB
MSDGASRRGSLPEKSGFNLVMATAFAALAAWSAARITTSTAWILDVMFAVACAGAVPFYLWRYWILRRQERRREEG